MNHLNTYLTLIMQKLYYRKSINWCVKKLIIHMSCQICVDKFHSQVSLITFEENSGLDKLIIIIKIFQFINHFFIF